jgi:hypothetical protein
MPPLVDDRGSEPGLVGDPCERTVPGEEVDVLLAHFERGRQMDCVVAAQAELGGEVSGAAAEFVVDTDRSQLGVEILESRDCLGVGLPTESTLPLGRAKSGPSLGVGEDAGRWLVATRPELSGAIRSGLDDNELDQRRGVPVDDQLRCSDTRSETEPVPST